jgi:membrane protease YdiL (CAAX protease family)
VAPPVSEEPAPCGHAAAPAPGGYYPPAPGGGYYPPAPGGGYYPPAPGGGYYPPASGSYYPVPAPGSYPPAPEGFQPLPPPYAGPPPQPFPTSGWFVLLVLIGLASQFVLAIVGALAMTVISRPSPADLNRGALGAFSPTAFMVILLVASLSWPLVAYVTARIRHLPLAPTFRLQPAGVGPLLLAVPLGAALVPVALLLENLAARAVPRSQNFLVQLMSRDPDPLALALLGVALVVAAPIGEELLFRGLSLGGLEKRHGAAPAALTVSLVFAAVHLNPSALGALFVVSLALCWVTSRTGSLYPAIVVHAVYNGLQYLALILADAPAQAAQKAQESRQLGFPWVVAVVGLGIVALCLWGIARMRPGQPSAR